MKKFFYNIKKYFKYAITSASAELKSEISDSYLNWLWWVIEPLCFMLIYTFIFSVVFKSNERFFPVFIFLGLTCWEFFNRMMMGSVNLITSNRDLISKVYVPKYILLLAKSFTYLFKLFISFMIAIVLMIFLKTPFTWNILYVIFILPILYLISFGLGCILMHLGVYIEDLKKVVTILLKLVFYLSGVFYNINARLTGLIAYALLRFNPVAFCMNEIRKVMLYSKSLSVEGLIVWFMISILICIIGIKTITKNENSYAKVI
ncbi:MAG: ABC transporter permease [Clostridia bacterium]|nr:ABC transporter permease [Clostridia bacterium]